MLPSKRAGGGHDGSGYHIPRGKGAGSNQSHQCGATWKEGLRYPKGLRGGETHGGLEEVKECAKRLEEQTEINDTMFHAANPEVPFGGLGQSGFGAYHGMRGVIELSHICGTLHQPLSSLMDPPFRYPPYTDFKMRILAFVLRYPGSELESLVENLKKRLLPWVKALLIYWIVLKPLGRKMRRSMEDFHAFP